jgi:hypothetical protein
MSYISQGSVREVVIQNGRVIRDLEADSFSQKDKKHTDFLIKGRDNNTPFVITNMNNPVKGTMRRFRSPTPYYPRRKTGKRKQSKRKQGKNKTGKKRKSASKR